MRKIPKILIVLAGLALLISSSPLFGQGSYLYNNMATQLQTRNIPAGTVVDPGSQLLYIIDSGVNLREAVGPDLLPLYNQPLAVRDQFDSEGDPLPENPFGVGGSATIYNPDGTVDPLKVNKNFITITNTHPTLAVTIHFRYFNDECLDVLDFLVVLTCNDTLLFDPFDFEIPETPFNTQSRIFGPAQPILDVIPARDFGSGRFLIFATAAGTSYEPQNTGTHDDFAELHFPYEFRGLIGTAQNPGPKRGTECLNLNDTYFGKAPGLVASNLHVFNSSAVAFNYLIGSWTTAIPVPLAFQAYGLNAWTRPAVDLTNEGSSAEADSLRGESDGDGPPLGGILGSNDFRILTGLESVRASNGLSLVSANALYLRNDVHGGDTARAPADPDINDDAVFPDYDSWYGAIGLTSIYGGDPSDQLVHFASLIDDYNGSRHAADTPVAGFVDRSYNLNGAETTYIMQLYNNWEEPFVIVGDPPPNISPLPPQPPPAEMNIVVDCLRTWVTATRIAATSVDDLQISDLAKIVPQALAHVQPPQPDPYDDRSNGWIRFVRDHSNTGQPYAVGCTPNIAGHQAAGASLCTKRGTWAALGLVNDSTGDASFVTIGFQVVKQSGFGAAWWLSSVASDPCVAENGVDWPFVCVDAN